MAELPDGLTPAYPDDAVADLAADGPEGPLATAAAFYYAVSRLDDEGIRAFLAGIVTPESSGQWGDFAEARDMLAGLTMSSRPEIPAPGMAYARFADDIGGFALVTGDAGPVVRVWLTLIWQPDRDPQWRVHALGTRPVLPRELPA